MGAELWEQGMYGERRHRKSRESQANQRRTGQTHTTRHRDKEDRAHAHALTQTDIGRKESKRRKSKKVTAKGRKTPPPPLFRGE